MRLGRVGLPLTISALRASALSAGFFGIQMWLGSVCFGTQRLGAVDHGSAQCGNRCRRQHWGLRLPLLLSLEGRLGSASTGLIRWGRSRQCPARQKLQTAARSFFGGSLLLSLESRCGPAWHGQIRHGWACCGAAGCNKDCRRQYGGFSLPTVLSGTGMVRRGPAMQVAVGLGAAR